jgi:hypothetical protein
VMASFRRMLEERMTALAEARGETWKPGGR